MAAQTSIDPKEAAHFGALAADWWDPKGSSAMLHKLNPVRLKYLRDRIDQHWGLDEHAGVELDYFEGFTQCTSTGGGGSAEDFLRDVFAQPMVRCDDIQWSFLGISMAGWNAILSLTSALLILWLSLTRTRRA